MTLETHSSTMRCGRIVILLLQCIWAVWSLQDAVNIPHSNADDSGTTAQCLNGCQTAVSLVMQEVAGNSSLQLSVEWHRTRTPGSIAFRVTKNDIRLPTVFSRVQFRYPGDEWQYYTQQEMFEIFDQTASFIISGFKPYTMYQVTKEQFH